MRKSIFPLCSCYEYTTADVPTVGQTSIPWQRRLGLLGPCRSGHFRFVAVISGTFGVVLMNEQGEKEIRDRNSFVRCQRGLGRARNEMLADACESYVSNTYGWKSIQRIEPPASIPTWRVVENVPEPLGAPVRQQQRARGRYCRHRT